MSDEPSTGTTLPSEDSVSDWTRRIQSADHQAFEALFQAMHTALLRYGWRLTSSKAAAQDVVQDAFLKLWQMREELDPNRSVKSLLYTMVRNLALNHNRAEKYTEGDLPDRTLHDESPGADEKVEAAMLDDRIRQCIAEMPPRRREAFTLSRFEGLSHEEIAQIMGLTPRTVNTHIVLALNDLRDFLEALETDRKAS